MLRSFLMVVVVACASIAQADPPKDGDWIWVPKNRKVTIEDFLPGQGASVAPTYVAPSATPTYVAPSGPTYVAPSQTVIAQGPQYQFDQQVQSYQVPFGAQQGASGYQQSQSQMQYGGQMAPAYQPGVYGGGSTSVYGSSVTPYQPGVYGSGQSYGHSHGGYGGSYGSGMSMGGGGSSAYLMYQQQQMMRQRQYQQQRQQPYQLLGLCVRLGPVQFGTGLSIR